MERGAFGARVVWFLRDQSLWWAPLQGAGESLRLGTPKRLVRVAYKTGRWLTLAASHDGCWLVIDDGHGLKLIQAGSAPVVQTLLRRAHPSFAPNGREFAVTQLNGDNKSSVAVLDLLTRHWRTLCSDASQPFWSANGQEIALLKATQGDEIGMVVDARSGSVRYQTEPVVSLSEPLLSPDGRFYADLCAISRPKLGHTIYDRRTGKVLDRAFDWPGRLPTELYGWSPNGKWLACNWRVPNPENDGTWLGEEVGLVSWLPGVCRWIDLGNQAMFSPDSQHLFWRRPTGTLCATTVSPKATPLQKLLTNVDAFAIQG